MQSNRELLNKGIAATKFTVLFRTMAQVIGLASTIFLVRTLSENDYGVYNLLYSVIALMGMVFSLGIANTLQRYMPEYYNRGEFSLAHRLYRFSALFRLLSNVIILAVLLFFWEQIAPVLKITAYKDLFILFTLVIVLHLQRGIVETSLNSYFLHKYSQGISVVFVLVKGFGYAAALLLQWNLFHIILVDIAAYLLVFTLLEWVYWTKIPLEGGTQPTFTTEEKKRLSRYAFFYNFNDIGSGMLDANFDNFILVMFLNPVTVGAYAFSQRINNMAIRVLPVYYLLDVIRPLFIASNKDKKSESVILHFHFLIKAVYIFQFPIFIFFILLSEEIIKIFFGGKFIDYYYIVIAVAFFNFLNAIQFPIGLVAQLHEKANIILYSKIFSIYNLITDFIFIYYFGIIGAVIATGTSVLFKNLFIWYFIKKNAPVNNLKQFVSIETIYWSIILFIGMYIKHLNFSILINFIIIILLLFISCIAQFYLNIFNKWEKKQLLLLTKNNNLLFKFYNLFINKI